MQTEFTCGIYTAKKVAAIWSIFVNNYVLAIITQDGINIKFSEIPVQLTTDDLTEISVLMNNIKRQYKQLQTT